MSQRPNRIWVVPADDLTSADSSFAIDCYIQELWERGRHLASRWETLGGTIAFGRRSLEASIINAHIALFHELPSDTLDELDAIHGLATNAASSLYKLMLALSPNSIPVEPWQIAGPLGQARLSGNYSVSEVHQRAREDAAAMLHTHECLQNLAAWSADRRGAIAGKRQNPGYPDKRAFVGTLCEGWIALTGKRPGKSLDPMNNPFLRFVQCAWEDAGQEPDASFAQQLQTTLAKLTKKDVERIAHDGPAWGRFQR